MTDPRKPLACSTFMRRQAVARELGIHRSTLKRIIEIDGRFPRFVEISPGIEVIERADFERWLALKRQMSRSNEPGSTAFVAKQTRTF